jgi:hypothetical protein
MLVVSVSKSLSETDYSNFHNTRGYFETIIHDFIL